MTSLEETNGLAESWTQTSSESPSISWKQNNTKDRYNIHAKQTDIYMKYHQPEVH